RLKTRPIDPRSLFRGNYAQLQYEISRIPAKDINALKPPRQNEIVYVNLTPGTNGLYHYGGVSLSPPKTPVFIKGRIKNSRPVTTGTYRLTYGIEAWFAPREKALAIEKNLRDKGIATIYITDTGKAALREIHGN
ncbi:MAG: GDYXXLXY domain-containing protein, partial [Desulfobacteraceae bacterium]|nr:GDYXXLXY domain-containing protein [Desulfobacteraceae bacterium]